jgi:uncharacterized protein YjbI with pentapeptide repeats
VIEPQRAAVRPRVLSPSSGQSLLLEDEILSLVERNVRGVVCLAGGPGSGKTTALAHLAAVLPTSADVSLCDDDRSPPSDPDRLIVCRGNSGITPKDVLVAYQLAPWTDDEAIEYLLARHRDRCESVMRRCRIANDKEILQGHPELWRHVVDVLAADEGILNIKDGLRRVVAARLPDGTARELASNWCLAILLGNAKLGAAFRSRLEPECDFPHLLRLLWHVPVLLMLASERIADELRTGKTYPALEHVLARELVLECASLIRNDPIALDRLTNIIQSRSRELHPMAASLLHAADIGWHPEPPETSGWRSLLPRKKFVGPRLHGAHLQNAKWPGIVLSHVELSHADLSGADLTGANLDDSFVNFTKLRGANLTGASLERAYAEDACLSGANLSSVRAAEACFQKVDAERACFEGAILNDASFKGAKLANARFARSNLAGADLVEADIENADFSQVNFRTARLNGLVLRLAEFRQCRFRWAQMLNCDLEGMVLPGADFRKANLTGALFTGSIMPRADFHAAKLINAGLAEIDWEHADLSGADLRGASFHMGSSRSGLVDSPFASLGTRTGFYTDDYNEQDFKSPEEIRKANLRGADLRGAKIDGVDFYLVDLRDALYDASQEQQLRSTRAILESRVP